MKHQEVVITTDEGLCTSRQGKLQIFVILGIAAISYTHRRFEPDGLSAQDIQNVFTPLAPNSLRELLATEYFDDFALNGTRKCKDIHFFGAKQRALRDAVHLECCTY